MAIVANYSVSRALFSLTTNFSVCDLEGIVVHQKNPLMSRDNTDLKEIGGIFNTIGWSVFHIWCQPKKIPYIRSLYLKCYTVIYYVLISSKLILKYFPIRISLRKTDEITSQQWESADNRSSGIDDAKYWNWSILLTPYSSQI